MQQRPRPALHPEGSQGLSGPEEPLAESAPLARRLAPELCRKDPVTGESCAWYHGLWQYLRLLGLITTPEHDAEFLRSNLGAAARSGARVLISGAADYAMLALVIAAFRDHNLEPDVTVVDLCETPLVLNRWYAERLGCRIVTNCSDILDYHQGHAFDVVCTHALLGRFAPDARIGLLANWRELLRPMGIVVTVNRVRPQAGAAQSGFTREQAQAFCDAVRQEAESRRESLGVDPSELAQAAEIYARNHRVYPVRSLGEISELFQRAGFKIDHLSCAPVPSSMRKDVGGPTTPGAGDHAYIVARRA